MDDTPTFSERHGYTPPEAEITVRYDAPRWLRSLIIRIAYDSKLSPSDVREILCNMLLEEPDSNNWSEFPNIDDEVHGLLSGAEWFQVYDLVEIIARRFQHKALEPQLQDFTKKLNDAFRRKGVGWQLVDGKLEIRGPEIFEQSVREAQVTLEQTGRQVARNEIHQALMDLSKRPDPDITGAIQHAMAALECVARDVTGDEKSTLGDLLKKHPGTLPPPLDTALSKIWGFASDQGRHLRESQAPDIKEAELVVGLAGSLSTYLVKKFTSKPQHDYED
jgi:hypothetical protein